MRTAETLHCLMTSKLFAGLGDTALRQILDAAQVRQIASKTNVITRGDRPNYLFLQQAGRARAYILTESGAEILLLLAVPGVVLGLVSLLDNPPNYMVNVTATSDCEFLVWDHATIRGLARACPHLMENSFRLALQYLGVYMKRHAGIVTGNAESRLAQTLLNLAREVGIVGPSGITIDVTNEYLNSLSDISPFTASRILSRWEDEHWLFKKRGRVSLLPLEDLEAVMAA